MSNIPQLMGGRELEHDLRFSNKGPMSGLVDGVQSTITMAATTTLVFNETSTANEVQMLCSILPVDPGGANRILKLPADVTSGGETLLSLAGRRITIFNGADGYGENIIVQLSDGTFVTQIGYADSATITFVAADTFLLATDVLSTTVSIADNGTSADLVPLVSGQYIVPISAVIVAPDADPADNNFQFKFGSTVMETFSENTNVGQDVMLLVGFDRTPIDAGIPAATKLEIALSDANAELRVKTFYRLLPADLA